MSTQIKIHNIGSVTAVRDRWVDPCFPGKPFGPKGPSKLMNLCTVTVVSGVHLFRASVQNDLAGGRNYVFATLMFKKPLFKCEERCKDVLDGLRRTLFDGAFHHNIVDNYYLKSFQKWLHIPACTQIAFKREHKTKHSI